MKNNKKLFISIEAALAAMILMLGIIIFLEKSGENLCKVSVIIQNSEDNQWSAFRYGLEMAAEDYGVELSIASTGESLNVEEELVLIQREVSQNADAIIIQPVPGLNADELSKNLNKNFPAFFTEAPSPSEYGIKSFPVVEPNHYAMGKAIAEELLADYNGNLRGKTFGIVTDAPGSQASASRTKGLEDTLKGTGAVMLWSLSDSYTVPGKKNLSAQPRADLVIALDDKSLSAAGQYSDANNLHGALVYGIGHSMEAFYCLDMGSIECLIVPDEFLSGYQILQLAAESIGHNSIGKDSMKEIIYVPYTVIRKDDLFSEENQEILFTMSQ